MARKPIEPPKYSYEPLSNRSVGDVVRLRANRKKAYIVISTGARMRLMEWQTGVLIDEPSIVEGKYVDADLIPASLTKLRQKGKFPRNRGDKRRVTNIPLENYSTGEVICVRKDASYPFIVVQHEKDGVIVLNWVEKELLRFPKDIEARLMNMLLIDKGA